MPITIEVHQAGDRTAIAMLTATICLAIAACAQVFVAIFQMQAANRQAIAAERQATAADSQVEAADRQIQATERAIEVSRQQIRAMKELEDKRTMPILEVAIQPYSSESAMPLRIKNQGAGPALRISCGRHVGGTARLDQAKLIPLSALSLAVGEYLDLTVSKGMLTPVPLYIHCFSAQGTEIIFEPVFKPDGRLSVVRSIELPNY